jgi:CBS domain-containing protein
VPTWRQRDNTTFNTEVRKVLARTVAEAMSTEVVTVAPGASLQDAAALMLRKKVNRLPVVAAGGALVGVLTRTDVVAALARGGSTVPL